MTRPAEMLGKLNPTVMGWGQGRGGVPELTRQDIAEALGMVRSRMGRALLEVLYWSPDAPGSMQALLRAVSELVGMEYALRSDRIVTAELRVLMADCGAARAELARAKADPWPETAGTRQSIVRLCVWELMQPAACWHCSGRGHRLHGMKLVPCEHCEGTGRVKLTDRKRARYLGLSASAWSRSMHKRNLHRWIMSELTAAAQEAEGELGDRLA